MAPAQQRLKADDIVALGAILGLIPDFKLAACQRQGEILQQSRRGGERLRHPHVVNGPAVTSIIFDVIHRGIGFQLKLVQRLSVVRIEADPRAQGDIQRMPAEVKGVLNVADQGSA
ncbi:hypothetical protein D3C78_1280890 [compost metagenome]